MFLAIRWSHPASCDADTSAPHHALSNQREKIPVPKGLRNYFLAELQEPCASRLNRTHFYQRSPLSGRLRIRLKEAQEVACCMIKTEVDRSRW